MKYGLRSIIACCFLMVASLSQAAGLSITTSSLPSATTNTVYTATLAATGGTGPYTWSISKVPAGFLFAKTGVLSGTPTTAGSYRLKFTVKDSKRRSASRTLSLAVAKASTAPAPTLKSSLPSPQVTGHEVTFTAGMVNGSGTYEYQFMIVDPVYPTLLLTAQPYSSMSSWTMNSSHNPGVYNVTAYIRKVGSTAAYDYTSSLSFTINPPPAATGVTVSPSLASPQMSGRHITLTAGVANTEPAYLYSFQFKLTAPDGTEKLLQDYSNSNQVIWNSFGSAAGDYTVTVNARQNYSTAAYEANKQIIFTLSPSTVVLPATDPLKYGRVLYEKGTTDNPAGNHYVFSDTGLSKFNADWNLMWSLTGIAGSASATFDKDGNIAGTFITPNVGTFFKRIDPAGNVLSSTKLTLPSGMTSTISTFDDAYNMYFAWVSYVSGSGVTAHLMKMDSAGNQLWNWQSLAAFVVPPTGMNNGPMASISGLTIGTDGNIYLSGSGASSNVSIDGVAGSFLMAFDAIGNKLSNVSVANAGGKLLKDGSGNFTTIGSEPAISGFNAAMDITKFSQSGLILWQKQLFPAMSGLSLIIRDYVKDNSGNIYILTSPTLPDTPKVIANDYTGIAVTKLDAEGNKLWVATGGTTLEEWITPMTLSVDDVGNMYVKAYTEIPGSSYKALVKFDAEGKQLWLK